MLNRTAWIAFLSSGLLCFVIFAPDLSTQARGTRLASEEQQSPDPEVEHFGTAKAGHSETTLRAGAGILPRSDLSVAVDRIQSASNLTPLSDWSERINQVQLVNYSTTPSLEDEEDSAASKYWPTADTLIQQIEALRNVREAAAWSEQTISFLEAMSQLAVNSNELDDCIEQLDRQFQSLPAVAHAIANREEKSVETIHAQCEVARITYRLQRRIAVWRALRSPDRQLGTQPDVVFHSFGSDATVHAAAFNRINFESLDPTWVEYLRLKELQTAFGSSVPNEEAQKKAARSVLARMYSPLLKPKQATYLQQVMDPMLISSLKSHAAGHCEESELLKRIEKYETQSSSLTGYYLNDQYQNLLWSDDPADRAIAAEIHTHYRNANFRVVVSERLLNRMIPQSPTTASPVAQNVKGAQVSGQSQVSNQLRVDLLPNDSKIQLQLATTGDVRSDTIARTKSFRIQNLGEARFQVAQEISISPLGIDATSKPEAFSRANQYVIGLQSSMDNVPLVGRVARKLAAKKLREEGPDNDRLFRRTVELSAETQMEQQVSEQLVKIRHALYNQLYQPLFEMDLEPESLQMASTDEQVVMRYRFAGRDQMAANTARPRDSGKSLLSFQIHQSTINNAIARIGLNGNKFTIDELKQHLRDVIGSDQVDSPEQENQQHAEIGFAYYDPIHIDFRDDQLRIKLNLLSLKIGTTGKTWRNVSLTASYRFAVDGMTIQLQQDDDGTRIKGKGLRFTDKAAISTVMKVLFKQQYSMNSVPQKLSERINVELMEISQLALSDGWLAVSIDDQESAAASNDQNERQRIGAVRKLMQRR